jgi:hypothetical protein
MDTNKKRSSRTILPLIGSSILTLAFLMVTGAAAATTQATAAFVASDTVSEGNWQGMYGSDGYSIANGPQALPPYATVTEPNAAGWTWATITSDVRAPQTGGIAGRIASTWFNSSSFTMDVNLTDGKSHQVALYGMDWDGGTRSETIQIMDANSGAQLDTRSISRFVNGIYLVWNMSGHVRVNITCTSGSNAVMSGIFFAGAGAGAVSTPAPNPTPGAAATFLKLDTATEGNSQANYGIDGYSIPNGTQKLPSYATLALQNQSTWTWAAATSDPRALNTGNGTAVASTWYCAPTFSFDVNMVDGKPHQFSIYALDWDGQGRSETVQMVDATTGTVLDTRNVTNFRNGVYLAWNVTGHVKLNVTGTSGPNAVISGVFFGGAVSTPAPVSVVSPAISTQPSSQTVIAGQTATFSVANTGTAPMMYQWNKNGTVISGATSSAYTTPAAASSDNGSQYGVSVSNGGGSVASRAATLTVNGTYILNASSASLNFGSVNLSSSSQQTVTFTNAGTANVTISNVMMSGAGFNGGGLPTGTILAPGQTASLNVTFNPSSTGNANGSVTVASNASNGTKVVALSGTGTSAAHSVALSWSPSTSTVIGYNVYFTTVSGSSYTKLTPGPVATADYTDSGLQFAQTRYYVVTSVDSNNNESAFSDEVSALIP